MVNANCFTMTHEEYLNLKPGDVIEYHAGGAKNYFTCVVESVRPGKVRLAINPPEAGSMTHFDFTPDEAPYSTRIG